MLCSIINAAIKRNLSLGWVRIHEVGFCTHDMNDDVLVVYVLLEFEKPLEVALRGGLGCLIWHGRKSKKE